LAVLAVLLLWFWLARSRVGFRITAVGANPAAAGAAGMPVARTVATAFLLSGALAGVAGGVEQLGVISRLFRYLPGEPGYGFSGIAVALLGQLHPLGVGLAALFFGALRAGSDQMQRSAGISFQVAYVIQAAVVLLLVLLPPLRTLPLRHRR
jgi:simple sugar transport system permease protein